LQPFALINVNTCEPLSQQVCDEFCDRAIIGKAMNMACQRKCLHLLCFIAYLEDWCSKGNEVVHDELVNGEAMPAVSLGRRHRMKVMSP